MTTMRVLAGEAEPGPETEPMKTLHSCLNRTVTLTKTKKNRAVAPFYNIVFILCVHMIFRCVKLYMTVIMVNGRVR